MAEPRPGKGKAEVRKAPRIRAGRNLKERHNFVSFHGHGLIALILFAIAALSVLGVGLAVASVTIFAVGRNSAGSTPIRLVSPAPSSSTVSSLVGHPIDGTLVAIWVDQNLVAIQPDGGDPVQASVTAKSAITRGGAAVPISELISGDSVIVTFSQGPSGTLVVQNLEDIETVPTNVPNFPLVPEPTPTPTPSPSPTTFPFPSPAPSGPNPAST
ncbi:MAG: hypothetical protein ABSF27_09570 [Candidatus Dormibacteria bacterium]